MRLMNLFAVAVLAVAGSAQAGTISGEYLEARTCDVYTGPCFANAEMDLAGKEAVMAWKVDRGTWNGVALDGLGVAVVVRAESTLGSDGIFEMRPGHVRSVVLVDEQASPEQQDALVALVKDSAAEYTTDIARVEAVPFTLENDHLAGHGVFSAGEVARIETRQLKDGDCVCTNEVVYYQPLTDVNDASPAYSQSISFQGDGLDSRWTTNNIRSAFLATFRK